MFDDAYNIIEGLRHGGTAQTMRRRFTDFGSGWDALRGLARAGETFGQMIKSKEFQKSLSIAKEGKELGEGMFGKVTEMMSSFRGQEFRFARKTGEIGHHEVQAMKAFEGRFAPTVYSSKSVKGRIDMELFKGKTLAESYEEKMFAQLENVDTEFLMKNPDFAEDVGGEFFKKGIGRYGRPFLKLRSSSGWKHGDIYLGNIMIIRTPQKGIKLGLIDWGMAKQSGIKSAKKLNTINMMDGNKSQYVFKAAHRAGKRHANMGY